MPHLLGSKIIVDTSPPSAPQAISGHIHSYRMIETPSRAGTDPLERFCGNIRSFSLKVWPRKTTTTHSSSCIDYPRKPVRLKWRTSGPIFRGQLLFLSIQISCMSQHSAGVVVTSFPDVLAVDRTVNGGPSVQTIFLIAKTRVFETLLNRDDELIRLAYYWTAKHSENGQYDPKSRAGLVFRVKIFCWRWALSAVNALEQNARAALFISLRDPLA